MKLKTLKPNELPVESENPWLVEGLIKQNGFGFIFGSPKSFKSTFCLQLAVNLSVGSGTIFGLQISKKCKTLYMNLEDQLSFTRERLQRLARAKAVCLADLDIEIVSDQNIRLDRDEDFQGLKSKIKDSQIDLLVIDPFAMISESISENSAQSVQFVIERLRALQREGVAVLMVHHLNKRNGRGTSRIRGSSYIEGAYETGIFLTRNAEMIELEAMHRSAPPLKGISLIFNESSGGLEPLTVDFENQDQKPTLPITTPVADYPPSATLIAVPTLNSTTTDTQGILEYLDPIQPKPAKYILAKTNLSALALSQDLYALSKTGAIRKVGFGWVKI